MRNIFDQIENIKKQNIDPKEKLRKMIKTIINDIIVTYEKIYRDRELIRELIKTLEIGLDKIEEKEGP